jgi:putative GTP pyrophosphokinase
MVTNVSKTQIDRLGERLKKGDISEDDLHLLETYRRSFADAYEFVVRNIQRELALKPTGRQPKTVESITEKLRRESIRLTQIQDIAGCRLIVSDVTSQDAVVRSLSALFENTNIVDRRQKPSHGYRAVHVLVTHLGKMVEIQVRTALQAAWANFSEKLSDLDDPAIKYGGGDEETQLVLTLYSLAVGFIESVEMEFTNYQTQLSKKGREDDRRLSIVREQEQLNSLRQQLFEQLSSMIARLESLKGEE